MSRVLRIGTRASKLAVIQAELVAAEIKKQNPGIEVSLVKIVSTGDMVLDKTLDKIGGKGLFVKELDEALARGDVDICVHSYKDIPAFDDPELPIAAVSAREDPRDVLILPAGINVIDPEKPVGCSSKRRQVQIEKLFPGQPVAPVRGNVLTRIEKLDRGEYSALVLAAAGVKRLGLWERVNRVFSVEEVLPAGGQGILAVQARRGHGFDFLAEYNDPAAWDAGTAERAFIKRLDCGCGAPAGVFGEIKGDELRLQGMIADDTGVRYDEITGSRSHAAELGIRLAEKMLRGGII